MHSPLATDTLPTGRPLFAGIAAGVAALIWCAGCGGDSSTSSRPVKLSKPESAAEGSSEPTENESSDASSDAESSTAEQPTGTLTGQITFEGDPPERTPLISAGDSAVKDADVCAAHDVLDESLVVNPDANNGIANVFVYLSKAPKGMEFAEVTEPLEMDQKGCVFLPHAMVVRCGQPVLVKSDDAIPHNVHTFPKRSTGINTLIQPQDRQGLEISYPRPEPSPVQVKCDVHTWMVAYHLPLDHPFMAITNSDGRFEISGLPEGTHSFRIWQERSEFLERGYEVKITAGETTEINVSFATDRFRQ